MAITQRTAVESQVTPAAANITVTKPTGLSNGDYMVISIITNGTTITAAPTGFNLVASEVTQANPKLYIYDKYITNAAGEGTWTFTGASSTKTAIAQAFIGVDPTTQQDVSAITKGTNSTGSGTMTAGAVTTLSNNDVVIYVGGANSSTTVITTDASMTPILESTGVKKQEMAYELRPTAGSTGSRAASCASNTLAWASIMFGIKPAVTASGPVSQRSRQSRYTQLRN